MRRDRLRVTKYVKRIKGNGKLGFLPFLLCFEIAQPLPGHRTANTCPAQGGWEKQWERHGRSHGRGKTVYGDGLKRFRDQSIKEERCAMKL